VYARRVGDEVLDFGHRGWLYESSTFLFYDYKTDSLWLQATGEAIHGSFKSTHLKRLPATHTTWSAWRSLHPDTLVLGRTAEKSFRYREDSYAVYYATGESRVKTHARGPLSFGLAVILGGAQKIYPFRELEKKPAVIDKLAGEPVLVVFHAATRTATAFDPRHNGKILDFGKPKATDTNVLLTDSQTGSTWSGLTGECLAGPAKGARLRQLPTTQFVMENWPIFYPKAAVYRVP
jgi:hypothetical protein